MGGYVGRSMGPFGLRPQSGRRSSGFSLDEATSLHRMVIAHADRVACPACGCPIAPTVGGTADERIFLVRCPACARGLVIHGTPEEPAIS